MYNDNTFNGLFTGTLSGGVYTYPSAEQNLVITFDPTPDDVPFHLSAMEGDFTTDAVTITSETGESEDITIGNAPAKVLTATMLNPSNTMGSLVWGDGKVYIGCETATATADAYNSYPVHVLVGSVHYSIDSSGRPRRNSTTLGTLGGTGVAVISNSDGSDVLFISTTSIGRRVGGSYTQVTTPSASQSYLAKKFRAMPYTAGVLLDANGCPSVYNSVEKNTKQTFGYVPMGVFDFSNVDAFGITFGAEAYDKMTVFDGDCTTWWNAIDFDNGGSGRRLDWLADELCQHYGFSSPTVSNDAVNGGVVWTANPITSYAVTGRDILKWLSEAMGCSARMGRTGGVELWTFPLEILSPPTPVTPVATITPDTIISNTRVKGKAEIPKLNQVQCYNVLGAGYEYHTGTPGTYYPLYIVANPFIDPSGGGSELSNIYGVVSRIPAFYPTTISVACGDPRWDAGDFVCITTTDGSPQFNIPIMHETLSWNGNCVTTLSATGKQVRDIPEGMNNTDLSSMVDSNPSAVVNKIQAVGISADWITSGTIDASVINVTNVTADKVTVKDGNDNTIFSVDADTNQIYIEAYNDDGNSVFTLDGTGVFQTVEIADWVAEDTSFYGDANDSAGHNIHSELNPTYIDYTDMYNGNEATLSAKGVEVTKQTLSLPIYTQYGADGYTVTNDDLGTSCRMSVIKILHDSANMTDNITLQRGMYLAIVTHTNNSTAGQQGLYLIQAYDTNSVVLTISAAANSTLTVSGLTLTWTTTNTYRALRLIYLS